MNLIALPVLSSPSFGFIYHMNLRGVPLFLLVAWSTAGVLALGLWRKVPVTPLHVGYSFALLAALLPVVAAWVIALHPLYWPDVATPIDLWPRVQSAAVLGGLSTAAYWLPASVVNCIVLRRSTV